MSESYLILHKVRGEPAFDIAVKLDVPSEPEYETDDGARDTIWTIPTSGHRAYPYVWQELLTYRGIFEGGPFGCITARAALNHLPVDWPDHYPTSATPHSLAATGSLAQRLGLVPPAPVITRRL